jgi:zinc D-Ala-D-Ala carboxypeptidase
MLIPASPGRRGRLSPHFVAAEFACPHCAAAIVSPELVRVLESIRAHLRRPLPIVSGYRCPIHNRSVGGAADSQHMYGRAADLPLKLVSISMASHAGAIGIGHQDGFVRHVDVREGPRAVWKY